MSLRGTKQSRTIQVDLHRHFSSCDCLVPRNNEVHTWVKMGHLKPLSPDFFFKKHLWNIPPACILDECALQDPCQLVGQQQYRPRRRRLS